MNRDSIRLAVIAGQTDCPMSPEEAAAFLGISPSTLRSSDIPRADVFGNKYLKSELLKYVKARLSHRILEEAA